MVFLFMGWEGSAYARNMLLITKLPWQYFLLDVRMRNIVPSRAVSDEDLRDVDK